MIDGTYPPNSACAPSFTAFIIWKSPEKGAEVAICLASSPELEGKTGRFSEGKTLSYSNVYSHDEAMCSTMSLGVKIIEIMEG
jgi:hypothetical protein